MLVTNFFQDSIAESGVELLQRLKRFNAEKD
jgi:hypothetical protein